MAKRTFENALTKLDRITAELEQGDSGLDSSLKKFEEGIKCSKHCSQILDETEKKITLLLQKQDGSVAEEAFLPQDESENE